MRIKRQLKKAITAWIILVAMGLCVFTDVPYVSATGKTKIETDDYIIGDKIAFGSMDNKDLYWNIVEFDKKTRAATVVSAVPLTTASIAAEMKAIKAVYPKSDSQGYVNWGTNIWRKWCNEIFYTYVFNSAEKKMIQKTSLSRVKNKDSIMNFFHDTSLDADYEASDKKESLDLDVYETQTATSDYVYFLSFDEYAKFKEHITMETGSTAAWPLRTNSYYDMCKSVFVLEDLEGSCGSRYTYDSNSIRVAMHIVLPPKEEELPTSTNKNGAIGTTGSGTTSTGASGNTTGKKTVARQNYKNNGKDSSSVGTNKIVLPDDGSFDMGKNAQTNVTIDMSYLNQSNKDYTILYSSSDTNIFTVNDNGVLASGSTVGSAVLTVRMQKSNGRCYKMTCRINVGK